MKKLTRVFLLLLLCFLLMGASEPMPSSEPAPVIHTRGFYVNDYAYLLFSTHRDDVMKLSIDLFKQTGIQVVLLTVDDLGGLPIGEYGDKIIRNWQIGGPDGADGILLLVSKEDKQSRVFVGENLSGLKTHEEAQVVMGGNNISRAIMDVYQDIIRDGYSLNGAEPDPELAERLDNPARNSGGPVNSATIIIMGLMVVILSRSYRASRKYKGKYLRGNVRKAKTYTRTYDEEKEFDNEKIYGIDEE